MDWCPASTIGSIISATFRQVARASAAVAKLHRLVVLSEGVTKDATFARQARRKFV